jgi:integrating conjugative element protein (TIGR03746 family)
VSSFISALDQARQTIKYQWYLIAAIAALAAFAMFNWRTATQEMTIHLPPDLSRGSSVKTGVVADIPAPNAYVFAFYVWQQVNRWSKDGNVDYGKQIFDYQAYLTPSCREQLVADMNARAGSGELAKRTRAVMEIPGLGFTNERVKPLGNGNYSIQLDLQLSETQQGTSVKDTYIRYPLRLVRYDVDRQRNPWQLALDCFGGEKPARLDTQAVEMARQSQTIVTVRADKTQKITPAAQSAIETSNDPQSAPPKAAVEQSLSPTSLPKIE